MVLMVRAAGDPAALEPAVRRVVRTADPDLPLFSIQPMDRVIAGTPAARAADLRSVRLGVAQPFLANLDADTRAAFDAALAKLRAAGVTIVEVRMPDLLALNGSVGFPVALYEAFDDVVAYLAANRTGVTIQQLAARIASPDVKATYAKDVLEVRVPVDAATAAAKRVPVTQTG